MALKDWPPDMRVRPWRVEEGSDGRCQNCKRRAPLWWTEDALWLHVMGTMAGTLCPSCFIAKADDAGVTRSGAWQLYPPGSLRG